MMTTFPPHRPAQTTAAENAPMPRAPLASLAARGPRPFLALFTKELRESGPFVLVCWAFSALVFTYAVYVDTQGFRFKYTEPFFFLNRSFTMIDAGACLFAGILLGFAPYHSQRTFDRWAFLAHRPLSRTRLFLYKTASQLILYTITAGVPLAILLAWAAADRRIAPLFEYHMTLPFIADFLLGLAALFAGSFIAQRNAHWAGTRFLPGATLLAVAVATIMLPEFKHAVAVELLAIAAFAVAAWAAAVSHGTMTRLPAVVRAVVALILFTSFAVFAVPFDALVYGAVSVRYINTHADTPVPYIEVDMRADGSPVVVIRDVNPANHTPLPARYITLSGQPTNSDTVTILPNRNRMMTNFALSTDDRRHGYRYLFAPLSASDYWDQRQSGDYEMQMRIHPDRLPSASSAEFWPELPRLDDRPQMPWLRDLPRAYDVRVVSLDPRIYVMYRPLQDAFDPWYFDIIDRTTNRILQSTTVDPAHTPLGKLIDASDSYAAYPGLSTRALTGGTVAAFGMPVVFAIAVHPFYPFHLTVHKFRYWAPGIVLVNIFAAAVMLLLARRYQSKLPRTLFWTALALLAGPLALALFLATHNRPVRLDPPRAPSNTDMRGALS